MNKLNNPLGKSLSNLSNLASKKTNNNAGQIILVKPSECYTDGNPRTEFDALLVASITKDFLDPTVGQQEPCHVYPKDEKGYRMQHGATRLLCANQAALVNPDFMLKVIPDATLKNKPEHVRLWEQGSNNIKRNNMSLPDRANFIANYMELAKSEGVKVTQAEIAERLGMSGGASAVSRLLKLRDMPMELNEVYKSGVTEDVETLANLVEIYNDDIELFRELIALPELDRAIVRKAKKSGTLAQQPVLVKPSTTAPTPSLEPNQNVVADVTNNVEIAHAQNSEVVTSESGFGIDQQEPNESAKNITESSQETNVETGGNDPDNSDTRTTPDTNSKTKKAYLKATIFGEVNGESCILVTKIEDENPIPGPSGKGGTAYVQIGGEVKAVPAENFVFKSVSYHS